MSLHIDHQGDGEPLVVLPAFGLDHGAMAAAVEPAFAADSTWRRWYVDLPGTGRSPSGEPSSDAVLDELVATIEDRLGTDRFALLGWSYGAYLGAGLIRRRSERILGMMMVCAGFKIRPADRDLTGTLRSRPEPDWLSAVPPYLHEHFEEAIGHQTVAAARRTSAAILANGPSDDAYLDALRGNGFALSDEEEPTTLDAPACLVTGRRDRIAGYRDAMLGAPYLPQADYVTLADAGHYLPFEQPEVFAMLVRTWLSRCRPSDQPR